MAERRLSRNALLLTVVLIFVMALSLYAGGRGESSGVAFAQAQTTGTQTQTGTLNTQPTTPCPTPTPTPTSTQTQTATPTQTTTASPTRTECPPPGQNPRTITIHASQSVTAFNSEVTISGTIFSNEPSCRDNEFVLIERRVHGSTVAEPETNDLTNAQGEYEVVVTVKKSSDFIASSNAHDNCATTTSRPETVRVGVLISIEADDTSLRRGTKVVFTGKVRPNHSGTLVILQRERAGRFVFVKRDELGARSRYRFAIEADWRGSRTFRVRWPKGDQDHEEGFSQTIQVRTRR